VIRRLLATSLPFLLTLASVAAAAPKGVNRSYMNLSASPCEDFFKYANGAWLDTVQIPPAYVTVGTGREMADRNQEVLHGVLEEVGSKIASEQDPTIKKLGALYVSLMDSARADREGIEPMRPMLREIDAVKTRADLQRVIAKLQGSGSDDPFRIAAEPDPKNSAMVIATFYQSGLGLPDRDYYFRTDAKSEELRSAYRRHIAKVLEMIGEPADQAARHVDVILRLETALAESSLTRVQMRDPVAIYHKMSVKQFASLSPTIDWTSYFTSAGIPSLANGGSVNVTAPGFMVALNAQIEKMPIEDWKSYLAYHEVNRASPWLGQAFFDERFAFMKLITGAKQPQPRWKRATQATDGAMGEALGKAYVARAFTPESKARMLEMVNNLLAAMSDRIGQVTWMSDATKAQAKTKLAAFAKKIGYPDQWRDYSALDVRADLSAAENVRRTNAFERRRVWNQIGKPVDRTEWEMSPPTVNAYYNPTFNEIVFPAGILQPPRFDPAADEALNYGAIGSVIGHEITHGFDDEGRLYDAQGNLKQWWTDEDDRKFRGLAQRVVDQYDGYVAVDTLHINGKLTLGENLADIGGLTIAYYAYQKYLDKHGRQDIDGFTPEQRFFIGFGQSWRAKWRDEILRTVVLTDPHSPGRHRVNGVVSNLPEFRKAFGCKDGDSMVRPEAVRGMIW